MEHPKILNPATKLIIITLLALIIWPLFVTFKANIDFSLPPKEIPFAGITELDSSSLTSRIAQQEEIWGVAEQREVAINNYNWFINEAMKIPAPEPKTQNVREYFEKISSLMNKYFIYELGTGLFEGLAEQKIDCDLRSFIFYDITHKHGLNTHIVYSPLHAFINWESPGQLDVPWETTKNGKGALVDLKNSFYRTSYDAISYRNAKVSEVIDMYEIITLNRAYEKKLLSFEEIMDRFDEIELKHPDWHFLKYAKTFYLYNYGDKDDQKLLIKLSNELIEMQPDTPIAHSILMEYYYNMSNWEKSKNHYHQIKPKYRDFETRLKYSNSGHGALKTALLKGDAYIYKALLDLTKHEEGNFQPYANFHYYILLIILFFWVMWSFNPFKKT